MFQLNIFINKSSDKGLNVTCMLLWSIVYGKLKK